MPATRNQQSQRPGQLPPVLFWAGVGLAPIVALVLLVGQSDGALRTAVLLVMVSIVLIGLSAALRSNAAGRAELEEVVFDEADQLRGEMRQDIAAAARATHRQFSEKLQALYQSVESLRAQVNGGYDLPEGQPVGVGPQFAAHPPAPAGHSGAAAVGHPHPGYAHNGHPHAGRAHVGAAGVPAGPPVGAPVGGVVRHTETVQVTTRHTYVDPHADPQAGRGTVYGGTPHGRPAEPAGPRSADDWDEPAAESWTEQRLRERLSGRGSDQRAAEPREGRRSRSYERDDDDPGSDERWSDLRAGDRWASVRSDERGRELRMGERRAALHADETGTELRIEDRWASVRREESRRWGEERWSEDRWGPEVEDTGRWGEREQHAQAALPSAASEPSWRQDWDDDHGHGSTASSGSTGRAGRRRYRDDDDDDDYGWQSEEPQPVRVRQRRGDHDALDDRDRWR